MYAVINTFEKNDTKDEITYIKVEGENLVKTLKEMGLETGFYSNHEFGKYVELHFFETDEEAEACMGSK